MPEFIAILEDNADRIAGMRSCLAEPLPRVEPVFFEKAEEMIAWLGHHLGEILLISLDHDLPFRDDDGQTIDCGTGREVADYLVSMPPTCPVIVHSSNDVCAAGMFFALKNAGWPCSRVYPCDDTAWITGAWGDQVRQYIRDGWISVSKLGQENTP